MFQKPKVAWPAGATTFYEVRYSKGRKPFETLAAAEAFAKAERASGNWAEIAQLGRLVVEKRA